MADPTPNPNPADRPVPAKTIRVGTEMFNDVQDYMLLIRDKDNKITTRTSSYCWAHGAMEQALAFIHADNDDSARGENPDE